MSSFHVKVLEIAARNGSQFSNKPKKARQRQQTKTRSRCTRGRVGGTHNKQWILEKEFQQWLRTRRYLNECSTNSLKPEMVSWRCCKMIWWRSWLLCCDNLRIMLQTDLRERCRRFETAHMMTWENCQGKWNPFLTFLPDYREQFREGEVGVVSITDAHNEQLEKISRIITKSYDLGGLHRGNIGCSCSTNLLRNSGGSHRSCSSVNAVQSGLDSIKVAA